VIDRYRVQPCRKSAFVPERPEMTVGREERLLRQVERLLRAAAELPKECDNPPLVPLDQRTKGLGVSSRSAAYERSFVGQTVFRLSCLHGHEPFP